MYKEPLDDICIDIQPQKKEDIIKVKQDDIFKIKEEANHEIRSTFKTIEVKSGGVLEVKTVEISEAKKRKI